MPNNLGTSAPYYGSYFGAWAIDEGAARDMHFRAMRLTSVNIAAHVENFDSQSRVEETKTSYVPAVDAQSLSQVPAGGTIANTDKKIAVISLSGVLMKHVTSLADGTSTVLVRRDLRKAGANDDVAGVLMIIDSPGGTVAGMDDLAADVAMVRKSKPVFVFIEDRGLSGGYYAAASADRIIANRSALIGSVGAYIRIEDSSGQAEMDGIKVHAVKSAEGKGAGEPGTVIDDSVLSEAQMVVDGFHSFFVDTISKGRGLPKAKVDSFANGKVYFAADALSVGLIDSVNTRDGALSELRSAIRARGRKPKGAKAMTTETNTTEPATIAQLESLPGVTAPFVLEQLKAGSTFVNAQTAWLKEQSIALAKAAEENKTLADERDAAKASAAEAEKAGQATTKVPGVGAVGTGSRPAVTEPSNSKEWTGGSAMSQFNSEVKELVKGGMTKQQAVISVCRNSPELHSAVITEANENKKPA